VSLSTPIPLEETSPELHALLKWHANKPRRSRNVIFSLDKISHVDALCKDFLRAQGHSIKKPRKIQRNDPCLCGSGRKYKKCHGK